MTAAEKVVNELWSYAYSLTINGNDIKAKHFGTLTPSKERLDYLKDELKKNKKEAIEYIRAYEATTLDF